MLHNFKVLGLLQILLVWCSQAMQESEEGSHATVIRRKRVVGGYLTDSDEFPYLVNIRKNYKFHCGGTLLTPKCVLTAAHCMRNATEKDFIVRAGVTYLNDLFHGMTRVDKIIIHPHFNSNNLNRDLAILVLEQAVWNSRIETISLTQNAGPTKNTYVTISGWGLTNEKADTPSNQIRAVRLRVISHKICQKLYNNFRNVTENMFCTAATESRDACLADSGGPAVNNEGKLVGVVSWGRHRECARPNSPGVFVSVNSLKPWIEQTLQMECY